MSTFLILTCPEHHLPTSTITNIVGNGHVVTYGRSPAANSVLGGRTYTLVNGGTLAPV